MNAKSIVRTAFCATLLGVSITACAGSEGEPAGDAMVQPIPRDVVAAQKNFVVVLKPVGNQVKVLSKAQGANRANENGESRGNGFVGYGRNESGWTFFMIKHEDPSSTCSVDGDGDGQTADWGITKIELSHEGDAAKLKGEKFPTSVPPFVSDSFREVNPDNGLLFQSGKDDAPTFVSVYNANAHEGDEFRLIYYRIELTPCGEGGPIYTDPAWGNSGRG